GTDSTAPTEAVPGDTYTAAATGGGSGNPVTFSSTTTTVCRLDGSTVTLDAPGTCTIAADQAAGNGFRAAQRVTQDIAVSTISTNVELSLDLDTIYDGQSASATAEVTVAAGTLAAAGGTVQFAVDGIDVGDAVAIDADGRATSPELMGEVGTNEVTATYEPRSEEHTSELQSRENLVCRLRLEKK